MPYPPKDGGAIAVLNFSMELALQGHKVKLLCMNTKKHFFPIEQVPENIRNILNITAVYVDASVKTIPLIINFIFSSKPYHQVRFYSKEFENAICNELERNYYDIVLFDGLYVMHYIDIIKEKSKAFMVYRAHNIENEIWQRMAVNKENIISKLYLSTLAKRLEKFEKKYINKVDLVLTLTERDEFSLKMLGCKKLTYVSKAGIPLKNYNDDRAYIKYPSIFFVGALDWLPNQEGLLWFLRTVWFKLTIKYPDICFEIAGRNAPEWLKKKVEEYPNVKFYGEIDDAKDFMKKRAIMVVPLFSGSGIRIKIIEGMAMGKTIVTTSIGAEGIAVEHNHNIMIADTDEQFYNSVQILIENKYLFEKIGCKARDFVKQHFDISTIVQNTVKFIEKAKS
jgi:glycosyltransferase involved in cell wall biosynthesis